MNVEELKKHLRNLQKQNDTEMLRDLSARKKRELEFHDKTRDSSRLTETDRHYYHSNKKFYKTVALSRNYINRWLQKHVQGKIFLDYACGNGGQAIQTARMGSSLSIGLDISPVSIQNAREAAAKHELEGKCFFLQADCEHTGLPDECIDVILCSGMLHHLDLSYSFPELRRILKKEGVILCVEALNYNPVIKLYRMMTPHLRTEWEKDHILSLRDIHFAQRFFVVGEIKYWHLLSPLAAVLYSRDTLFKKILRFCNTFDHFLLDIPIIRLLAWQFTFVLRKPSR